MTVFSEFDLKQRADEILKAAHAEGEVRIRARNGEIFALRSLEGMVSGLDVAGVETNLTLEQILQAVREGRERG